MAIIVKRRWNNMKYSVLKMSVINLLLNVCKVLINTKNRD